MALTCDEFFKLFKSSDTGVLIILLGKIYKIE